MKISPLGPRHTIAKWQIIPRIEILTIHLLFEYIESSYIVDFMYFLQS